MGGTRLSMSHYTSVHSTMGYTPFYITFGRQAHRPIDILCGPLTPPALSPAEYDDTHLELGYQRVRVQLGHQLG